MVFDRIDDRELDPTWDRAARARARRGSRHAAAAADSTSARQGRRRRSTASRWSAATIRWLVGHGVRDLVLNLHHRPESIAAAVGDGSDLGARVRYSWESAGPRVRRRTAARAAAALTDSERWRTGTCVLVNGDTLTDVDLPAMLDAAPRARGALVTMALIPNPRPDKYGGVLLDAEARHRLHAPRQQPAAVLPFHRPAGRRGRTRSCRSRTACRPSRSSALYPALMASRPGAVAASSATPRSRTSARRRTAADLARLAAAEGRPDRPRWGRDVRVGDRAVTRSVLWDDVTVGAGAHRSPSASSPTACAFRTAPC